MRSLFRCLETQRVRYLVISGQASILYGAALFSEDLDLWVEPSAPNITALLRALRAARARVHKLTPPLSGRNVRRGHAFHFMVPQRDGFDLQVDVMGQPPRVGSFASSERRSERMKTPWGRLPVVGLEDLVEIKKTNRPADYEVITRLALIRLRRESAPPRAVIRWALQNMFRIEDLWETVHHWRPSLKAADVAGSAAARLLHGIDRRSRTPSLSEFSKGAALLGGTAGRLQARGRAYWLPIIGELKRLRSRGELIPEGLEVSSLIPPAR